ncbi:MAG TPA: hypothetical protein PLJ27_15230 [Polyangiaceae bacterium]|jgi:hypothetical protein|nr:hypothetical protein [Polyangiaceae bacterium]HQK18810.1 hypothetical protein [Polyangiaceae bacterium]
MTNAVRNLLLTQRGIVFVSSHGPRLREIQQQAQQIVQDAFQTAGA